MVLVVNFFEFSIKCVWFVVAIFDIVHDVETMHGLCQLLIASENLF